MRHTLGIPESATVFCRHGGWTSFSNRPAAHEAVNIVARRRADIYFVFANTKPFEGRGTPNVIHLNTTLVSSAAKAAFIRSCDAMPYARTAGETFGLPQSQSLP